jgi:hypothetical protein
MYVASNAQTITVSRLVYWRTVWNTTHKLFWRFLSPQRFAS